MAAITFGVIGCGALLDRALRKVDLPNFNEVKSGANVLRPAELACLIQPDDLLHMILVMALDLMQRAVKATLNGEVPVILDYEVKMWELTKDFLKQSTAKKVEPYKPENFSLNPIGYFKKLSALNGMIVKTVRRLSTEFIKDPRHIRKYFSLAGLMRLVTDFFTAGYQDAVKEELMGHLTKKRLLVSADKCAQFSKFFMAIGILFSLASIIATMYFLPQNLIIALPVLSVFCAISVQLTIFMRDLIPLYSEFDDLLAHLKRRNWRVSAIRAILYFLRFLSWSTSVGVFMFTVVASTLVLMLLYPGFPLDYVDFLATLSLALVICFTPLSYGLSLRYKQVATSLGKQRLQEARRRVSKVSPIASFWEMIKTESYDPQFSEIVAIYGIAPLIILA